MKKIIDLTHTINEEMTVYPGILQSPFIKGSKHIRKRTVFGARNENYQLA
jgi:kynurenine formamidase